MLEKPLQQFRSYDGQSELDISKEIAFAETKLEEQVCSSASEDTIRHTMKKIGTERSQLYFDSPHAQLHLKSFTFIHDTPSRTMSQNFCMVAKQGSEVWMGEHLCFYKGDG